MAISFNPGQTVSPPDWDAWVRQHGGNNTPGQPVPMNDPAIMALLRANPALSEHLQQYPPYRYYMADGTSVIAFGTGGDDVQVVDYKPSQQFLQAQRQEESGQRKPTRTYTGPDPATGRPAKITEYDRGEPTYEELSPSATQRKPTRSYTGTDPKTNKPARITEYDQGEPTYEEIGPEKPGADKEIGSEQVTDASGKTVKRTTYQRPDNTTYTREDSVQAAPKPPPKPISYQGGDGKTYVQPIDENGMPTGAPTALAGSGEAPKPTEVNGQYGYWKPDEAGGVTWVSVNAPQKPSAGPLPADIKRPEFTAGQITAGLRQVQRQLDQWVREAENEQERTARKKEAAELMEQEHAAATTYMNEQRVEQTTAADVYGTQVQQRGQDASMINQRTSAGASMANQAVGTFLPLLRYAQSGSGDPVAALSQLMGMMRGNVASMGGLVDLPGITPPQAIPGRMQGQPGPSPTGTNVVNGSAQPGLIAPYQQQQAAPVVNPQTATPGSINITVTPSGVTDTTDAGGVPRQFTPASATNAPQAQMPDIPPVALANLLEDVERQMAGDPNWGIDDLNLIQQGVSPFG